MTDAATAPGDWSAIVAAARGCVGTRFRAHGRRPGLGLDCVGVVLVAAAALPMRLPALPPYRLGGALPDISAVFVDLGATRIDRARPGDVLVIAPAPDQRHVGIVTQLGLVHAHAGLGRVVEAPIDPDWQVVQAWRLPGAR
jgi:murein DD-endopeptidase / murein LD-carboxypeptidase